MSEARETPESVAPYPGQARYAMLMHRGAVVGRILLLVTFAVYLSGVLAPQVPLDILQLHWGLDAASFVERTGMPRGWGWLVLIHKGDILNFAAIGLMASIPFVCLLSILPTYLRRREYTIGILIIIEAAILALAASGLLVSGP